MDSLLALDLRKRLRRTVGNSVPVARMLGGITVHELIDALRVGSTSAPSASLSMSTRQLPTGSNTGSSQC